MSLIQPKFLSWSELLSHRLFRIPQYQRAYSWQNKQREDMFDDIRALRDQPERQHFMATVVGLRREKKTIVTDEYSVVEVVDGQQRLTTLIVLLKTIQMRFDDGAKLASELQGILVKEDQLSLILLQMNHDPNGYFAKFLRHGTSPSVGEAKTLADKALLGAIKDCRRFVERWIGIDEEESLTDAALEKLIHLTGIVKNRLTFIFHEIADEATVYSVFEVLNSRGLPVPWLDRLKSLLMGLVFESRSGNTEETINELHTIWEGIYSTIGLTQGFSTEALRFAATLRNESQRSKPLGEEEAVESLVAQCGGDPVKAVATSHWILQVCKAVDEFLGNTHRSKAVTRIAHARLLAVAIGLTKFPDARKKELLNAWEKISFRIFGLCRKDARTQVGSYVRLAWDCHNTEISADKIERSLSAIGSEDRELSVDWAIESVRRTNCYEGWEEELRYLMYRYDEDHAHGNLTNDQWIRIWEGSAAHSVEHILPQSTSDRSVNYLGNLMLLPPGMNSELGARDPLKKIPYYRSTGLLAASEVADTIEANGGWTQAQIEAREDRILEWVRLTWS